MFWVPKVKKDPPGPVCQPLCLWWCQPPVISVLSLHLFHLPPLLFLSHGACLGCWLKTWEKSSPSLLPGLMIAALWMWFQTRSCRTLHPGTQKRELITPFWPSSTASSQFRHLVYLFISTFSLLVWNEVTVHHHVALSCSRFRRLGSDLKEICDLCWCPRITGHLTDPFHSPLTFTFSVLFIGFAVEVCTSTVLY